MFITLGALGVVAVFVVVMLERRPGAMSDPINRIVWKGGLLILVVALLLAVVQGFRA